MKKPAKLQQLRFTKQTIRMLQHNELVVVAGGACRSNNAACNLEIELTSDTCDDLP